MKGEGEGSTWEVNEQTLQTTCIVLETRAVVLVWAAEKAKPLK